MYCSWAAWGRKTGKMWGIGKSILDRKSATLLAILLQYLVSHHWTFKRAWITFFHWIIPDQERIPYFCTESNYCEQSPSMIICLRMSLLHVGGNLKLPWAELRSGPTQPARPAQPEGRDDSRGPGTAGWRRRMETGIEGETLHDPVARSSSSHHDMEGANMC